MKFKPTEMKTKKQITITENENEQVTISIDDMSLIEAIGYLTYFRDLIQIQLMKKYEELTINK